MYGPQETRGVTLFRAWLNATDARWSQVADILHQSGDEREQAIAEAHDLYEDWRRNRARIRDITGYVVAAGTEDAVPADY